MSIQTLYLGLVVAAFSLFAVVLMGMSVWARGDRKPPEN